MTRVTRLLGSVLLLGASAQAADPAATVTVDAAPSATTAAAPPSVPAPARDIQALPLPAAGPVLQLPEVLITATRMPRPAADVPDALSVLTPAQAWSNHAADLGQALAGAPGVAVNRYGGEGSLGTVSLRGAGAAQAFVAVDGRPINQASSGLADLSQATIAGAERIEVVRGPASMLYGSSAIGGAVNVIPRRPPTMWEGSITGEGGTGGAVRRTLEAGGPLGPIRVLAVAAGDRADGTRANSPFAGEDVLARLEAGTDTRVSVTGQFRTARLGAPGPVPPADPTMRSLWQTTYGNAAVSSLTDGQTDDHRTVDARVDLAPGAGQAVLARYFVERERTGFTSGDFEYDAFFNSLPITRTSLDASLIQGAQAQYTLTAPASAVWPGGATLALGTEWRKERSDLDDLVWHPAAGRTTVAPGMRGRSEIGSEWAEAELKPLVGAPEELGGQFGRRLTVTGGARMDRHSVFGDVTNPHGGVVLDLDVATLRAAAGTSFRAPAHNDLFWPRDAYYAGNPALRPERGRTEELSVEVTRGAVDVRLGGFRRSVHDQIGVTTDATGFSMPQNVALVRTAGMEVEATWGWRFLTVRGNATSLSATQRQSEASQVDPFTYAPVVQGFVERRAAFVPAWTAAFAVAANLPTGTTLSAVWHGAGDQQRYFTKTDYVTGDVTTLTKVLPGYGTATLRASQSLTAHLEAFVGVDNVADARYATRFGNTPDDGDYPAPGRTWFGGATLGW